MKLSQNFTKTIKEVPSDETSNNAQLLIRAGYIYKTMPGAYTFLPLGLKMLNKIEEIVRNKMNEIGGQETMMNLLQPKEWWQKTDRWDSIPEYFTLPSQTTKNEYRVAPTDEEMVVPIAQMYVNSWKDLPDYDPEKNTFPLAIYQIQTKFRDEIRSKAGLMRGREFRMKDLFDFHTNKQSQEAYFELVTKAYLECFKQMGLDAFSTDASGGVFSKKHSREFQVVCPAGEDWTVVWSNGHRENLEIAKGKPTNTHKVSLGQKVFRENLTEEVKSVTEYASTENLDTSRIFKSILFATKEDNTRFVGICIRGDLSINEDMLAKALDWNVELRTITEEEMIEIGTERGRTTSIKEICSGYKKPIYWIFDESIRDAKGMISSYYKHVDIERDCINPNMWAHVANVEEGFAKIDDPKTTVLEIVRSAEVGNIFDLGTKFTDPFEMNYMDPNNQKQKVYMSCHGIGTTRCMGVIAEIYCDENGLKLPESIAPFKYHLISIKNKKDTSGINEKIDEIANLVYQEKYIYDAQQSIFKPNLQRQQEIIWDDRDKSSVGQKLKDADLIGLPYQIIISKKSIEQGGIEIKNRSTGESKIVDINFL